MNPKPPKRRINGVLLLDKPVGISSNAALQRARWLYRAEKAGHTGVLDPLASGLLPVCFGEAAKFAQYLLDADKAYTAALRFGAATATGDAEGEIVATARSNIDRAEFQAACAALTGRIRQVPPMFSALKHQGKPLYEYARQGIVIERKAREIEIYQIDIQEFSPPDAVIGVHCGKGTYIRTLAEDLAKQTDTFAYLTALRRTATAGFSVRQAYTLDALAALDETARDALLLPCDALVAHLPRIDVDDTAADDLRCGRLAVWTGAAPPHTPLRTYDTAGRFVGLAAYAPERGCLKAVRLMSANG
ncbi:tRNA pseudouridine(55) synthase TruB [Conchiformibius kuhniae]|uniref:tRNA pseudouridine synthase B n=1 Tax=Conchiformibius kuhniae TaxID=211502 RepID=A0A8T9MUD4_9NEIS|nr:tRNA pseudouridine(55) synthase TruB [Conchiformibius kuhniae]UOP05237.1 tRNA pseudouridine(55) synthase TruB [Conchiformibius kuhniae]